MTAGLATDLGALAWLRWLLAPEGGTGSLDGTASTVDGEQYRALPTGRHPRVVVPVAHPRATRAVLDGDLASQGAARRVTEVVSRLGRLPPGLGTTFTVPSTASGGASSLRARLAEVLEVADLQIGVTIGGPRPNRKPVLKLVTADGTVVAYAKIGWNPLTEALVANERTWLDRIAVRRPPGLTAPEPWTSLRWKGTSVLVTRPLTGPNPHAGTDGRRRLAADGRLLAAIAGVAPRGDHELTASPWWADTDRRVAAVDDADAARRLTDARSAMACRMAGTEWRFGAWHGDLTAWNAHRVGDRVIVWDWERASAPVPIGLDAAHAAFQEAQVGHHLDVSAAAASAEQPVGAVLAELGLDADQAPDLVNSYLIERYLRWDEDRRLGSSTASTALHDAILGSISNRSTRPGLPD